MLEKDARMLSQDAQEEMRRQAIRALISGKTQTQVGEELGVQQPTVNRWWKRYEQGGWNALKKRKRGRKLGSDRKLNGEQELEIQKWIVDHTPDQLKLKFALWTREAVRQLIMEKFGVEYNLKTMSEVLRRWGFTPQRSIKKAYEQHPAEVKKWLDETYPEVEKRAKEENAEIWWGDETAVKPECHFRRGCSPKGKTSIVRQPAKRFHSSLISAINNRGKMQWMALDQALNTDIFLKFLKQLIKYRRQKIILIVDNLKVHHSYKVKQWVEKHKDRLELVYLPAYSPDLNPDVSTNEVRTIKPDMSGAKQYLNNDLKQNVTKEKVPADKAELDAMVWMKMTLIELAACKIQSFFRRLQVRYAGL